MTNIHKGDMDILLVEDDPSIGGFLQAAMDREPGYRLHWETKLKDAWKAWEKRQIQEGRPFALILLDLGLLDGDGQGLIHRFREHGGKQALIIISHNFGRMVSFAFRC